MTNSDQQRAQVGSYLWRVLAGSIFGSIEVQEGPLSLGRVPQWPQKCSNIVKVAKMYKGCRQKKKNSIFVDIIHIKVDLPPSYPIFDKIIFDKVLIMLTSLPPLEFLT